MKILTCPINGPRPIQEFHFGGEYRPLPDPDPQQAQARGQQIHHRQGEPGVKREWWYHTSSGTWFIAERDNVEDRVIRTYLYTPERGDD